MNRFEYLQARRREAHLVSANAAWAELRAKLDDLGTDARQRVRQAVSATQVSWDIEFDMHFAADMTPQACEALLGDYPEFCAPAW